LPQVSWRLGEQILALALQDGDALISTQLAIPFLRQRLAAAAAGPPGTLLRA